MARQGGAISTLSIVADIVCNPLLKAEDIEMEKKIVIQEIGMCENDPSSYIHDLFAETMWKGNELYHRLHGLLRGRRSGRVSHIDPTHTGPVGKPAGPNLFAKTGKSAAQLPCFVPSPNPPLRFPPSGARPNFQNSSSA